MNRRTEEDVLLDGTIPISKGTYIGYNGYTTNRDADFWGSDAEVFRPARWGSTTEEVNNLFRKASSKATFISFHGGKRTCLGQKFAMTTARISLAMFLKHLEWNVDPAWPRKMTPVRSYCQNILFYANYFQAGPLMPKMLRLQFRERQTI